MQTVRIPLRARDGAVRAYALIDDADVHLAELRWSLSGPGYAARRVDDTRWVTLHRELLGLTKGDRLEVDHINGDKLDNRRANLRLATREQNCQNVAPWGRTSRHRGVSRHKGTGKWQTHVQIAKRTYALGVWDDEEDAACAVEIFRTLFMPFAVTERSVAR